MSSTAPPPGVFITFEGTEGCGKSTQIQKLEALLIADGYHVRTLREPGGTPLGEELRQLLKHSPSGKNMAPETELLLMTASRAQLVREVIRPALAGGDIVLCDRFYHSTIAYQSFARGLDRGWIDTLTRMAVGETLPDLTLLLSVPIGTSEQRRKHRAGQPDRFEQSDRAFFERVEQGYRSVASGEPGRVTTIDGTRAVGAVAAEIAGIVRPLLQGRLLKRAVDKPA